MKLGLQKKAHMRVALTGATCPCLRWWKATQRLIQYTPKIDGTVPGSMWSKVEWWPKCNNRIASPPLAGGWSRPPPWTSERRPLLQPRTIIVILQFHVCFLLLPCSSSVEKSKHSVQCLSQPHVYLSRPPQPLGSCFPDDVQKSMRPFLLSLRPYGCCYSEKKQQVPL